MTQTHRGGVDGGDNASHVWSAQGVPCKSIVLVEQEGAGMLLLPRRITDTSSSQARDVLVSWLSSLLY